MIFSDATDDQFPKTTVNGSDGANRTTILGYHSDVDVKSKFTFFAYLLFTLLLKIHFFDVSFDSYLHPYE